MTLLLVPTRILAASIIDDPLGEPATNAEAITKIIERLQNIVWSTAGGVAVAMMIYGGIILITAGGNEDKVAKGKKILTYGIGGTIFIISSYAIINIFIKILGGQTQ